MAENGEKRSPTAHRTPGQIKRHSKTYQSRPDQVKNRVKRNQARAKLKKEGVDVRGKDVDHKKPLSKGGSNSRSNLRVTSVSKNRGRR